MLSIIKESIQPGAIAGVALVNESNFHEQIVRSFALIRFVESQYIVRSIATKYFS